MVVVSMGSCTHFTHRPGDSDRERERERKKKGVCVCVCMLKAFSGLGLLTGGLFSRVAIGL